MTRAAQALSTLVFLALLFAMPALAGQRVIKCDDGDSLQKALDSGTGSASALEIQFTGTCNEDISFSRDRVIIRGDGAATISGQVRTFSSDQIHFIDLNMTGPGAGLIVTSGRVRLTNVNIFGNEDSGILARNNAAVNFRLGSLSDNGGNGAQLNTAMMTIREVEVARNQGDGILAMMNSSVSITDVNLHENGSSGIAARMGSTIAIESSQVWGNHFMGAHLTGGSNGEAHASQFNGNHVNGLDLTGMSTLDLHNVELAWNGDNGAWISEHSMLRLFADSLVEHNAQHGLALHRDSGAVAADATVINGNHAWYQVVCHGEEDSIDIDPAATVGEMSCSHPEY